MSVKKRNQVSAEFNMSSLTDIIFLLLIFFMLTSSIVAPNALNLKLPGSSSVKQPSQSELSKIRIATDGDYYLDGRRLSLEDIETKLTGMKRRSSGKLNVVIEPASGVATEHVAAIMDSARKLDVGAVLAAGK